MPENSTYLLNDEASYIALKKELDIIARAEKCLEIYCNQEHRFHTNMRKALPINPILRKVIAQSPLLLELFYLLLLGDAGLGLVEQFGVLGFVKELAFLIDGTEKSFSITRALRFGFTEFFKQHNIFFPQEVKT